MSPCRYKGDGKEAEQSRKEKRKEKTKRRNISFPVAHSCTSSSRPRLTAMLNGQGNGVRVIGGLIGLGSMMGLSATI